MTDYIFAFSKGVGVGTCSSLTMTT